MRRATITLPDELDRQIQAWRAAQAAPPSLTAIVQAALRAFLQEKRLEALQYRPASSPLLVTPAGRGSGHTDTAVHHDRVLADRDHETRP